MGLMQLFKEKKTPEEVKEIRETRTKYNKYIRYTKAGTANLVKGNLLTPETAASISKVLMDAGNWLKANPNADLEDINSSSENTLTSILNLIESDKPKIVYKNYMKIYSANVEALKQQGKLRDDQYEKSKKLIKDQDAWFKKNVESATELEYSNQIQEVQDKALEILGSQPELQDAKQDLQKAKEDVKEKPSNEIEKDITKSIFPEEDRL